MDSAFIFLSRLDDLMMFVGIATTIYGGVRGGLWIAHHYKQFFGK